ncbi:unnamed protein product [Parnassius mnemosyne]|uniref:DDE-1 domain-containing protein n=1 Tax=Parnassius mnemosyne TaxID=213953 RepID=A0AAV1LZB3_9NEOP
MNYDETNLTDCKTYIYKRGTKYPERILNNSKTAISLMFTGTAHGELLPIYVVYKSDHLWDTWLEGGPEGTRYSRSKSGWFDAVCFKDWFNTIIVPYAHKIAGRKLLIGDNLSSYFSENLLKTCKEINIAFVCLPPKTTHLLQPLDVAFFAPLKTYWRDVLTHWKLMEERKHKTLVKNSFHKLLGQLKNKLVKRGAVSRNLEAGFSKSGLYPINPELPKSRLPQRTNVTDQQINNTTLLVVTEILQEIRNPLAPAQIRRKRKCDVQPGKSMTAADLVQSELHTTTKSNKKKTRKAQG